MTAITDPIVDDTRESAARAHRLGVLAVVAIWAPIFLWMSHLASLAALARYVETHREWEWTLHLDTAVNALPCIAIALWSLWLLGRARANEADGTPAGRTAFLASLAFMSALVNLALIIFEEAMVIWIIPHGHG